MVLSLEKEAGDALEAHCSRVAAWSLEMERTLKAAEASPAQLEEILELAEALELWMKLEPYMIELIPFVILT